MQTQGRITGHFSYRKWCIWESFFHLMLNCGNDCQSNGFRGTTMLSVPVDHREISGKTNIYQSCGIRSRRPPAPRSTPLLLSLLPHMFPFLIPLLLSPLIPPLDGTPTPLPLPAPLLSFFVLCSMPPSLVTLLPSLLTPAPMPPLHAQLHNQLLASWDTLTDTLPLNLRLLYVYLLKKLS